jgi:hypothetical protein
MFALPYVKFRAFAPITNLPLVGGKLYSYEVGTTTPKALYADPALTEPLTNPVILDSNGEATIYGADLYDLKLTDALDVELWTADSIAFDQSDTAVVNTSLEWVSSTAATFVDVDEFTVVGDQTGTFHVNRRVRAIHTGTTRYGTIVSSTFNAGPVTTSVVLLLDSGVLAADLLTATVGILDSINDSIPAIVPFLSEANTFTGVNTFTGAVVIDDTLNVTGAVDLDSSLNVDGAAVIDLTLSVGTDLSVGDDADVLGDAHVFGNLTVDGTISGSAAATQVNALGVGVAPPSAGQIQTSGNIIGGGTVSAAGGFVQPGISGETLKMLRGIVDSAGAVIEGAGFTAVRNSTGNYTVTFSTPFSDIPSFQGCPVAATGNRSITIISASTTQVNYENRANNDNALANNDHHVFMVGPA